jgi:hypothetical protein
MDKGIYAATRAFFNISTPMSENEVDKLSAAARSALIEMRPYIEKTAPDLISGRWK